MKSKTEKETFILCIEKYISQVVLAKKYRRHGRGVKGSAVGFMAHPRQKNAHFSLHPRPRVLVGGHRPW